MLLANNVILADDLEPAFVGIGTQFNKDFAIYDVQKCIEEFTRQGMTEEEAVEYFEFNVQGSWAGEFTPIFLTKCSLDDLEVE